MCGITGVYLKNPEFVQRHEGFEMFFNALMLGIESRGKRATGMIAVKPGGHGAVFEKADVCASDFIEVRKPLPEGCRIVLGHTRLDTKGDPKENVNNHPVVSGSTFVTHNGSVYNDDELFRVHKLERKAEVDSEAIAAMVARYGLDEAKFSLEKIRGVMAIAAIDPLKFPDKLVLARGESMPLNVLENDQFIVWSSETKAIREAWGLVLGTPPGWKKFHTFKEGEMWVVDDGQVTKTEFKPFRKWVSDKKVNTEKDDGTTTQCHDGGESSCGVDGSWYLGGAGRDWPDRNVHSLAERREVEETPWTTKDFRKQVAALRAAGNGIARVMNHTTAEQMEGVGAVRWTRCNGCTETVLYDDVRKTILWGKMCEDCYGFAIKESQAHYANPANDLDERDKLILQNWCVLENMVHERTLNHIAEKTNLDQGVIDWLIFRVPKTYTDGSKRVNDLAADLDDMYQEFSAAEFERLGVKDHTDPELAQKKALEGVDTENPDPFVVCPHGIVRRHNVSCGKCNKPNTRSRSPFTAPPPVSQKVGNKTVLICQTCPPQRKQPAKVRLGKFAFCGKHWDECHNPECPSFELAKEKRHGSVATTTDGKRLCHKCIRGVQGSLFDGALKDRGIFVEQL